MHAGNTFCSLVVFGTLVISAAAFPAAEVPSDLNVVARFGSGFIGRDTDIIAWNAVIDHTGRAFLETITYPTGPRRTRRRVIMFSHAALERLVDTIDAAKFWQLPTQMLGEVTDSPTYILEITERGKKHKVRVYAPYDVHDKASLRRFRLVWEAIFQVIPSPDGGDAVHHLKVNS
jgi:hypothetical protein